MQSQLTACLQETEKSKGNNGMLNKNILSLRKENEKLNEDIATLKEKDSKLKSQIDVKILYSESCLLKKYNS